MDILKSRNISISAHIDVERRPYRRFCSTPTGFTQFDVRERMEWLRELTELEQAAIDHPQRLVQWGDSHINIIDTPGHVDFTVEVERFCVFSTERFRSLLGGRCPESVPDGRPPNAPVQRSTDRVCEQMRPNWSEPTAGSGATPRAIEPQPSGHGSLWV